MRRRREIADYLKPEVLAALGRLDLRARTIAAGFLAGSHRSFQRGFSAEFASHRRYVPGDPTRLVDWTAWARTDRLHVREFRADTGLACHLVVDASASMGYGPGPMGKLRYATSLAGALAYVMNRQGDPVGLLVLGRGAPEGLAPSARPGQLARVLAALDRLHASGRVSFAAGVLRALPYLRRRGIVALVSDLQPPSEAPGFERVLAALRSRGHDVICFHVVDADEARPPFCEAVELRDLETGEAAPFDPARLDRYRTAFESWRAGCAKAAARNGADYVALDTSTPFWKALLSYLRRRAGR